MAHRVRRAPSVVVLALLLSSPVACISRGVRTDEVHPAATDVVLTTPTRAHLADGTTVVYLSGVRVGHDTLRGSGTRYDLTGRRTGSVLALPTDSVAAIESLTTTTNTGATVGLSTLTVVGGTFAAAALAVAIFGSCPTIYSDSAGRPVLEAETFSYSIAPLFEARDVDRLVAGVGPDGLVRLDVRNEALETHYLNHLELLDARHAPDETVLPDPRGRVLAVSQTRPAARVIDRAGRSVGPLLAREDGRIFRTDPRTLRRASITDFNDYLEITAAVPPGADTVALVLTLRNSLLNTVLLYDEMLGAAGARAVDWLGSDLATVNGAIELGRWYSSRMGMRISAWRDGAWQPVARLPDAGPIAWRRTAVALAAPAGDSLRLRLEFVADNWRIDRLAVGRMREVQPIHVPLASVVGADGVPDTTALASLRDPDANYLETTPGQRFEARFAPPHVPPGTARTFLLASQGYYTEWIRGKWIRRATSPRTFVPSDTELVAALRRWRDVQGDFERRFESTRIQVR